MADLTRIWVRTADAQRQTVQYPDFLDGSRMGLQFRWSALALRWYMSALALDGTRIFGPVTLVPGTDLFAGRRHDPRVPRGQLFVYSVDRTPPSLATVDSAAVVYYRPA